MVKNLHGDTQTPELGSSPSQNNDGRRLDKQNVIIKA